MMTRTTSRTVTLQHRFMLDGFEREFSNLKDQIKTAAPFLSDGDAAELASTKGVVATVTY